MPDESKKSHDKKKGDPKEQRRPRQRNQQGSDKKQEKKTEDPKNVPKVSQKPARESPPPEFYKNLKRETDEILKITEEENSKYKKKEIQSNWSKYEMPIESYDEIEEQENLGADYEKLIQAPMSIGGHFQFKHEKSWDLNTGPSLYDKYFEINMDELNTALNTIPFYERNSIEEDVFSQTDILTMNNRSTRFKQKYYNDKSYSTPETEALDKICSSLSEGVHDNNPNHNDEESVDIEIKSHSDDNTDKTNINLSNLETKINTELNYEIPKENVDKTEVIEKIETEIIQSDIANNVEDIDFNEESVKSKTIEVKEEISPEPEKPKPSTPITPEKLKVEPVVTKVPATQAVSEPKKNPVIESPEDLEKWLDDFLDG
ncbi:unnamed protein product [Chrysodeixis includens]|uniref:Uncharacterized protein n=1 Tax=Chrysodeixis includens TaxID=689277 RepID=A0A9P0BVY9_CHRIL|nr:unnamed protein product [Chrysodeixis includens]